MNRAYWNEPSPLAQEYPETPYGLNWIQGIGIIFGIIAMIGILPGAPTWPGPWWLFGVILVVPTAIAAFLFWVGPNVARANYNKAWKTAFRHNNVDLKLFYPGIDMVIEHLQQNTGYADIDFESVAVNLACSLRKSDPFAHGEHSTFSWEVLHAYYHFMDASQPLIITSCPRRNPDTDH